MNLVFITCLHFLIISQLCATVIPDNYDPSTRPNNGGVADVINVSLDILAIREVNEDLQHISVEFVLHKFWDDKRLANLVERETIFADTGLVRIWTPHISMINSADVPNRSGKTLSLKPDGTVDYSERISAKISCPISMMRYPFGKQHCKMQFISRIIISTFADGYSPIHLILLWNGITPLDTIPTFDPEYVLYDIEQSSEKTKTFNGKTTILNVELSLRRSPYRLIATALLPTFLLAAFSYWVTFFMSSEKKKTLIKKKCQSENCESESKITLEDVEQKIESQCQSEGVEIEDVEVPMPETSSKNSNPSSVSTNLIKVVVNVFMLLIVVLVKQINFIKSPRSNSPTALDIWMGLMSLSIFICFLSDLTRYFRKRKSAVSAGENKSEGTSDNNCMEGRGLKILRICIPVVFLLFLITFVGFVFS